MASQPSSQEDEEVDFFVFDGPSELIGEVIDVGLDLVIPTLNERDDASVVVVSDDSCSLKEDDKVCSSSQPKKTDSGSDSDTEMQGCPICFEPWSNSGSHRLCCLNCGHLFGRSCIERWLKGKSSDKCPQCNCPAKRRDIRNLYCKALKVIDTSERDSALASLEEEKGKRMNAEQAQMRIMLQFEMAKAEVEKLKEQIKQQSYLHEQQIINQRERFSSSQSSQGSEHSVQKRIFVHQKTIQISQTNARVMAFDKQHGMIAISKPSPNQLFPGYGVVKVSSLESRTSEYVSIHQNVIRDVSFNSRGGRLLLSASMDKSLKLTSMTSNTVVQSYTCPSPVWSCQWNNTDTNYMYCGLQNGTCLVFDIRKTDAYLRCLLAPNGTPCPVVSIAYVPPSPNSHFSIEGLLVGTLNGGWFWEKCPESEYLPHPLQLCPGSLTGISFEENTRQFMASYRPSKYFSNTKHIIYKMRGSGMAISNNQSLCSATEIQQCNGGSVSKVLAKSMLFSCAEDTSHLYAVAGDEASKSALVWDCSNGVKMQKMTSSTPVLDCCAFYSNGCNFLATLTDQKLSVYRWDLL
eukprot:gene16869-18573_t